MKDDIQEALKDHGARYVEIRLEQSEGTRLTYRGRELEEIDVEPVDLLGFHYALQQVMGLVGGSLIANESQTLGNPVDVGVHGHCGHPQRKAQYNGGSLLSNAWKRREPCLGLVLAAAE